MPQALHDEPGSTEVASDSEDGGGHDPNDVLRIHPTITLDEGARVRITRLVRCCDHTLETVTRWGQHADWLEPTPRSPRALDQQAVTRKLGPGGTWTRDLSTAPSTPRSSTSPSPPSTSQASALSWRPGRSPQVQGSDAVFGRLGRFWNDPGGAWAVGARFEG